MSNIIIGWDREARGEAGATRFECPVETPDDGEHATCQWYVEVGPMKMTDIRIERAEHSVTYSAPNDFARVESIVEGHLDLCHPGKKEELLAAHGRTLDDYAGWRQRHMLGAGALLKQQLDEALALPGDVLDATPAELIGRYKVWARAAMIDQAPTEWKPLGMLSDGHRFTFSETGGDAVRLSPAEQLSRPIKCCGYPRICGDACIN